MEKENDLRNLDKISILKAIILMHPSECFSVATSLSNHSWKRFSIFKDT